MSNMTTDQKVPATAEPQCPNGHGSMILRDRPGTAEQVWCGTWYDCALGAAGASCKSSYLIPSAELLAQRDGA